MNGLQLDYQRHGGGGIPLLRLHGGLFNLDRQFGPLRPRPGGDPPGHRHRRPGHGRTGDLDRPRTRANLAAEVVGLLGHLAIAQADVVGCSVGRVARHLAIKQPRLVRRLVLSSGSFHPAGTVRRTPRRWRPDGGGHRRHANGPARPGQGTDP